MTLAAYRTKYQNYLRSEHWKEIRQAVIERDGYRCVSCLNKESPTNPLEVHHLHYCFVFREWLDPAGPCRCLVTMCRGCHYRQHNPKSYDQNEGEQMKVNK